jgi:hypothetical protein
VHAHIFLRIYVQYYILSRVGVTDKTGFVLYDWIYCTLYLYIQTFCDYRQYSAIAILYTLEFTVANALGFSVFSSLLLATDLSQSHCNFNLHMKSSWHSLISFLPLFCSCQFRRLDSIQFLTSRKAGVPKPDSLFPTWLICFYYFVPSESESESESYVNNRRSAGQSILE